MDKYKVLKEPKAILTLFSTIFLSALGFFESSSIYTAIPSIQNSLHPDVTQIQWILNSFVLVLGILILISGSLSDYFGAKKVSIIGLIIFGISTLFCGLSQTTDQLIVFRVLEAIGAALLIPQSLAIINNTFDNKVKAQAIGIWGGVTSAIAIVAPIIAGIMIDKLSWRSIFFTILPLCVIAGILIFKYFPKDKQKDLEFKIDFKGLVLVAVSFFLICFGLIQLKSFDSANIIYIVMTLVGIALLPVLFFVERKQNNPIIDFRIFKIKEVLSANVFTLLLYSIITIVPFIATLFLQQIVGWGATEASVAELPMIILLTALSFYTGKLSEKWGVKNVLLLGGLLVSASCASLLLISKDFNYWYQLFPSFILMGFGFGLFVPGLSRAALNVDEKNSGMASGFNNAISRIAGLLAIAVLGNILAVLFGGYLNSNFNNGNYISTESKSSIVSQSNKLMDIQIPNDVTQENKQKAKDVIDQSFISSAKIIFALAAVIAFVGAISAWFILRDN